MELTETTERPYIELKGFYPLVMHIYLMPIKEEIGLMIKWGDTYRVYVYAEHVGENGEFNKDVEDVLDVLKNSAELNSMRPYSLHVLNSGDNVFIKTVE